MLSQCEKENDELRMFHTAKYTQQKGKWADVVTETIYCCITEVEMLS